MPEGFLMQTKIAGFDAEMMQLFNKMLHSTPYYNLHYYLTLCCVNLQMCQASLNVSLT